MEWVDKISTWGSKGRVITKNPAQQQHLGWIVELQQKAFGKRCCQDLHWSGHLHKQKPVCNGQRKERSELLSHRKRVVEAMSKVKCRVPLYLENLVKQRHLLVDYLNYSRKPWERCNHVAFSDLTVSQAQHVLLKEIREWISWSTGRKYGCRCHGNI